MGSVGRLDSLRAGLTRELAEKTDLLRTALRDAERVVVAYGGGRDSAVLAWFAREMLGDGAVAVTVVSDAVPAKATRDALQARAKRIGIPHVVRRVDDVTAAVIGGQCRQEAEQRGIHWITDGTQLSDVEAQGMRLLPLREAGVRSLLAEAGFTRTDVEQVAAKLGL